MDELYFEEGYVEARYFGVIANASSGSRYFLEGYLPSDYFEYRGSFASVSCDFEVVIIGTTKEFEANWQSAFEQISTAQKTADGIVSLNAEFTQTSQGVRGQDTDLFAFSDAAIQAQVDRIRDINQEATAYFSVSADVARIRALDTDAFGGFSFVGNVQRSRATEMETQAAFSFNVSEDLFKAFGSALSDEFTQTTQEDLFKAFDSAFSVETTQTIQEDILRGFDSNISFESTLTSSFRVVRDAHLTGTGVAAIICDAVKTTSNNLDASIVVSLVSNSGFLLQTQSTIRSYSSVFVSRNAGGIRPLNLTNGSESYSTTSKFGTYSFNGNINTYKGYFNSGFEIIPAPDEDFAIDGWIYIAAQNSNGGGTFFSTYNQWLTVTGEAWGTLRFRGYTRNLSGGDPFSTFNFTSSQYQSVGWHHIVFSRNDGERSIFLDGTRIYNSPSIFTDGFGWAAYPMDAVWFNFAPTNGWLIDEWHYVKGSNNGFDATSTSITVPTAPKINTADTIFLHHFEDRFDDTTLKQLASANLSAVVQQSTTATAAFEAFADITANFNIYANGGKLEEINLEAFGNASVITDAVKITDVDVTSEISTNQTADAERIRDNDVDTNIAFTQTSSEQRLRDNDSQLELQTTLENTISKFVGFDIQTTANTAVSVLGGRLEEINLVAFSNGRIEISVRKTTGYSSDINTEAQTSADVGVIFPLSSDSLLESSVSANQDRLRDNEIASQLSFDVSNTGERVRFVSIDIDARHKTTQTYYNEEFGLYIEDGYFEQSEVTANIIANGSSDITSEFTISAQVGGSFFAELISTSAASVDATAVKQVSVEIDKASEFAVIVEISPIRDLVSNIDSEFTIFANGITSGEINAVLFDAATLSAIAEATKLFDIDISSEFTQIADTFDSLNGTLASSQSSEFSQSSDVNVVRDAVIATESVASSLTAAVKEAVSDVLCETRFDIIIDGAKVTDTTSNNDAALTISISGVKTADGIANLASNINLSADGVVVISAEIATESIASTLTAVARTAAFFVNADVVSVVNADVNVVRSAESINSTIADINVDGGAVRYADSQLDSITTQTGLIGVVKPFEATIASAMAFVSNVREIRIDVIVYVIPAEGWTYKIGGEGREYQIIGESRIREIAAESRSRTIKGESRIYIVE